MRSKSVLILGEPQGAPR